MKNSHKEFSKGKLIGIVSIRLLVVIPLLLAIFLIPAGTFAYWEAWLYMAILFIPMFFVFIYLIKNEPELLTRRLKIR
jgi:phosphoglycerol transferase MdoB-like AlkP superfamily enzyme